MITGVGGVGALPRLSAVGTGGRRRPQRRSGEASGRRARDAGPAVDGGGPTGGGGGPRRRASGRRWRTEARSQWSTAGARRHIATPSAASGRPRPHIRSRLLTPTSDTTHQLELVRSIRSRCVNAEERVPATACTRSPPGRRVQHDRAPASSTTGHRHAVRPVIGTQCDRSAGPAQDQRVVPAGQLDQARPGARRHGRQRSTRALGADHAALRQQDLLGAQPALPVLVVDQR